MSTSMASECEEEPEQFEGMVSYPPEEPKFPEPSMLDRYAEGWTLNILGENNIDIIFFKLQEMCTQEELIVELNTNVGKLAIKNHYGECLFEADGEGNLCGSLRITLQDKTLIGREKCDKMYVNAEKTYFLCKKEFDNVYKIYTFDTNGCRGSRPIANINWENCQIVIKLHKLNLSNETKALIISKAVQIGFTDHYSSMDIPATEHLFKAAKLTPASSLYSLDILGEIKIMKTRKFEGSTWYYQIRNADEISELQLIFEFEECSGVLIVKNKYGVRLFHACGIKDVDEHMSVWLHDRIQFGYVRDGQCYTPRSGKIMSVKVLSLSEYLPFQVLGTDNKVIGQIYPELEHSAVSINVQRSLCVYKKAIILAYAFKASYHFFEFETLRNTPDTTIKSAYISYPRNDPSMPSRLNFLRRSNNLLIKNLGTNCVNGIHYYMVQDCIEYEDTPLAVFEVNERLENVQAVAKSITGKPQFLADGLWDMNRDLVVNLNSGAMVGLVRDKLFLDANNNKLMVECLEPNSDLESEDENCDEDLEYPRSYKLFDFQREDYSQPLAEIALDESAVKLTISSESNVSGVKRALMLSYALKVAYNIYQIHKEPKRQTRFEYKELK